MCEGLGCPPSQLYVKHPNMTRADKLAMMRFAAKKYVKLAELIASALGGSSGSWTAKPTPMTGGRRQWP